MRSPRSKLSHEIFGTHVGSFVSQRRLGARFGRTASWVSRQGDLVAGRSFNPGLKSWWPEVWERLGTSGRNGYRRIA